MRIGIVLLLALAIAAIIFYASNGCNKNSVNAYKQKNKSDVQMQIVDSNVYSDINLFQMKGIDLTNRPTSFPYIKMNLISPEKISIIYKHAQIDSTLREYEKRNDHWYSFHEWWADTGYARNYEYIYSDKTIELSYYGSHQRTGFHLEDVTITTRDKEIMYSYWDETGPIIEPDIKNVSLLQKKCNVIVTNTISNKKGILKIASNSFDRRTNKIFQTDTTCYDIGNHSWFWYRKFGWNKKVDCNSVE